MECEMCGKNDNLFKTEIEGSTLNVCAPCSKYGRILSRISTPKKEKKTPAEEPALESVARNYPELIKKKREQMNLKQEELAKKINEKESVIHHAESGIGLNISTARKLEKALKIRLVELEIPEQIVQNKKNASEEMTIGDILQVRKNTKDQPPKE